MSKQKSRVFNHLQKYGSITAKQAMDLYGIMQFAKQVPSDAKQIAQLDESGRKEIDETLDQMCKKFGVRRSMEKSA